MRIHARKHRALGAYSTFDAYGSDYEPPEGQPARFVLETPTAAPWGANTDGADESAETEGNLLKLLATVIKARDPKETHRVWRRIKRGEGKPSLGLEDVEITTDLVHFLLFRTQVPDLFCVIVHQHRKSRNWKVAFLGRSRKAYRQCELVPLVAALMEAVHYVKRVAEPTSPNAFEEDLEAHTEARKGWEGHGFAKADAWWQSEVGALPGHGHNTWWHTALSLLLTATPAKPRVMSRYQQGKISSLTTSLLERAMLCSELSTVAFEQLMARCQFSKSELASTLDMALRPGNLRGSTTVRITSMLYAQLWQMRPPERSPWEGKADTDVQTFKRAWQDVVMIATGYDVVHLHTTAAGTITIPCTHNKDDARDPSLFVDILDGFISASTSATGAQYSHDGALLSIIACHAMHVLLHCGASKTHLVEQLLQLANLEDFLSDYLKIPTFLSSILTDHENCWDYIKPILLQKPDEERDALVYIAMDRLMTNSVRHGVQTLLAATTALPAKLKTKAELANFIIHLCAPAKRPSRVHLREIWEDLKLYLEKGGVWDAAVLQHGLEISSEICSGVAVEVFVSPPYNVRQKAGDLFSSHVVAALLAPGEQAVLVTGEAFAKRQRVEGSNR